MLDWGERHGRAIDVGVACCLFALAVLTHPIGGWHGLPGMPGEEALPRGAADFASHAVLTALATLPLAVRRRRPWPVFAVVIAASVGVELLHPMPPAVFLACLLAVYTVVSRVSTVQGIVAGVLALAVPAAALIRYGPREWMLAVVLATFSAWGLGWVIPGQRRLNRELIEHEWLVREAAEQRASMAVLRERARLASEIHDVVGHAMSIVVLRAGVAREVFDRDPDEARRALGAIEEAARTAMTDLRRLLDVLSRPEEREEYGPQPGLADIPGLIERMRAAGVDAELRMTGTPPYEDRTVELSAFRICEEALVNVLKHAGRTRAWVRVDAGPDMVRVRVTDAGPAGHGRPDRRLRGGRGLRFLGERAAFVGGTLTAGERAEGGFEVRAVLPYGKAGG
ncbi:histidine kinase [Spongiactinospora sp. TRM90649]|uniref:sensor histidine kinase n=1 Tax=Spongiactinospora sp. TRM90649 TaxID=3031114 RepID=UPI0023F98B04|nr:histidine kinase [Spongiactinospora sp. TRM90649]MDF5753267.1 histidine kinase [Spongiactinospora sp. TRM90649]